MNYKNDRFSVGKTIKCCFVPDTTNANFLFCTILEIITIHVCVCVNANISESTRVGYYDAVTLVWEKKLESEAR